MKQKDLVVIAEAVAASMPPSYERDKVAFYIVEALIGRYPNLDKGGFWKTLAKEDELRWEKQ